MQRQIHGILLLDKPLHLSSNDALQRVKRLFQAKKAGHTGSLDPLATGMLPICFGEATKFSQFLLDSDKTYDVVAKLGAKTNTGDAEGEIIANNPIVNVTIERVESVLQSFVGESDQVPPMFSAIKFQGQPLYQLARRGVEVERQARRITIFSIHFLALTQDELTFRVHCSKGTYIRTLVEDIGDALGCGAYVAELRRTKVKPYNNAPMYTHAALEAIRETNGYDGLLACLLPLESTVEIFPAVKLSSSAAFYMKMGQPVRASFPLNSKLVRLFSDDGRFLGMGEVMPDGRVKPHRMLATEDIAANEK